MTTLLFNTIKENRNLVIACTLISFILGASLVYFTPLKYSQVVEPKIHDVAPKDIYEKMKENPEKYDFIDVRDIGTYTSLHAEGARSIPLYKMYFERHNLSKKNKEIVLICSGGVASGVAAMYLEHFGFSNVVRVDGGIENWQVSDLPVVVSK